MPNLSIISLSFNRSELLSQTLRSVLLVTKKLSFECIVVDNASHDDSVAMVRQEFPQVKLVLNEENLGFAKAVNRGIDHSQGEYILLLNSDTLMEDNVPLELIKFMETHPRAGVAGPRILWPDGRLQLGAGGFAAGYTSFLGHYLFLDRLSLGRIPGFLFQQKYYQDHPTQLDWVSCVCMIVRREVLDQVGKFDERFFMYAEDIEWCDRVRRAGWGVYYCPQISIYHYLGGSSKTKSDEIPQSTVWIDSLNKYLNSNYGLGKTIALESIATLGMIGRLVLYMGTYLLCCRPRDRGRIQQMHKCVAALGRHIMKNVGLSAT
jgi:GT2 family glycosyltransferase